MNNLNSFAEALATETGIDETSALKVVNWLAEEGVLDFPVVNETYITETIDV